MKKKIIYLIILTMSPLSCIASTGSQKNTLTISTKEAYALVPLIVFKSFFRNNIAKAQPTTKQLVFFYKTT